MIVRARSQANCSVSYKNEVIFHDKEFKNNYQTANITNGNNTACNTYLNAHNFIIWKGKSENRKCNRKYFPGTCDRHTMKISWKPVHFTEKNIIAAISILEYMNDTVVRELNYYLKGLE